MREPLIAANWKMHKGPKEANRFIDQLVDLIGELQLVDVVIFPPFVTLESVGKKLAQVAGGVPIALGAQNMHPEEEGAYTGEVSPRMLQELNCDYVILGHSERRQYFDESDTFIHDKVAAATTFDLVPVLCIGEKEQQRDEGKAEAVVAEQLRAALKGFDFGDPEALVIAYEPVWAIGTGKTATPDDAQAMHAHIRGLLTQMYGEAFGLGVRILYGGSVKPGNIDALMAKTHIDGALVGGASLEPESFFRIVDYREDE
jgi:triosephosphate isomerase